MSDPRDISSRSAFSDAWTSHEASIVCFWTAGRAGSDGRTPEETQEWATRITGGGYNPARNIAECIELDVARGILEKTGHLERTIKVTRWRIQHSHIDAFSDEIITTRQPAQEAWAWRRTEAAEPQAWEGLDHVSSRFAEVGERTPEEVRTVLEACLQG